MRRDPRQRPLSLAVTVSVLLHAALLLFAVMRPVPPTPLKQESRPLELTWLDVAPKQPEPRPDIAPPPTPKPQPPRRAPKPAELPAAPSPPSTEDTPRDEVVSAAPWVGPPGRPSDQLLPRVDVLPPVMEASRGHTLFNDGTVPDPRIAHEEEAAHVAAIVDGWARDELAQARVESGLVDPYFVELRRAIGSQVARSPDFTDLDVADMGKQLVSSWQPGAARYAKTGAPFDAQVMRSEPMEVPSAIQRGVASGSPAASELAMRWYAGARLRELGDGKLSAELYAEVEFRQGGTGRIEKLELLRASGVPQFDRFVLDRATQAVSLLDPLDGGLGSELRSVWGFRGRVAYKRALRDVNAKDDWWYLAVAGVSGLLTGTLDEMKGDLQYVDLRHPHYECTAKLLRVYR
jgi:hypothetical protein